MYSTYQLTIPMNTIFKIGTLFLVTFFVTPFLSNPISSTGLLSAAPIDDRNTNHRSIGDYRRDLKKFMKLSKNDDDQLQRNAIFNLCALHHELVFDPRFKSSDQIQSFRVVVAKRLNGFAKEVKKAKLVEQRNDKKQNRILGDQGSSQSSAGFENYQNTGEPNSNDQSNDDQEYEAMFQSASQTYQDLGQISGGPNQVFNYAGGQYGSPWDHGDELVALIQNTVDPDGWRDNGGNASIHYFRPLRVLVINASQRTHDKTEDLLWMLRASQ